MKTKLMMGALAASCAVSPAPKGDINIPATLGGVKVTRIGRDAFRN